MKWHGAWNRLWKTRVRTTQCVYLWNISGTSSFWLSFLLSSPDPLEDRWSFLHSSDCSTKKMDLQTKHYPIEKKDYKWKVSSEHHRTTWWIFHCHVWLPEGRHLFDHLMINDLMESFPPNLWNLSSTVPAPAKTGSASSTVRNAW